MRSYWKYYVQLCALALVLLLWLTPAYADSVEEDLITAYENRVTYVDLTEYRLNAEQLQTVYHSLKWSGQLPWYSSSYRYTYNTGTGEILSIEPMYLDPQEYSYRLYEEKVAQILDAVVLPDMNSWQIALALHDYLATNCSYDYDLKLYTGYDALVRGSAVCSGYAEAYLDLMTRAGVPCEYVRSTKLDHAWNLVNCNGNWLHVDVTWDDTDVEGGVEHKYFLLSDAAISDDEHGHYGWQSDRVCDFTDWDEGRFWHQVDSSICSTDAGRSYLRLSDGKTGYIIYALDYKSGDWTAVADCDAGYIDIGANDGLLYFYHSKGLSADAGLLYYCDMVQVYALDPVTGSVKSIYTHDYANEKTCIIGCHVVNGTLYLTLRDHAGNYTSKTIPLQQDGHQHSYECTAIAPTCKITGYDLYQCACGHQYRVSGTELAEHVYGEGTVTQEPTTTTTGIQVFSCIHCGAPKVEILERLPAATEEPTEIEETVGIFPTISVTAPVFAHSDPTIAVPDDESWQNDTMQQVARVAVLLVVIFFLLMRKKRK